MEKLYKDHERHMKDKEKIKEDYYRGLYPFAPHIDENTKKLQEKNEYLKKSFLTRADEWNANKGKCAGALATL